MKNLKLYAMTLCMLVTAGNLAGCASSPIASEEREYIIGDRENQCIDLARRYPGYTIDADTGYTLFRTGMGPIRKRCPILMDRRKMRQAGLS